MIQAFSAEDMITASDLFGVGDVFEAHEAGSFLSKDKATLNARGQIASLIVGGGLGH
jgi:hypothetical protein